MSYYGRELHHINLMVPNIEEAVAYYTETLGFKITARFDGPMKFVFVTDGQITYELLESSTLSNAVFDHIAYNSDDLKADYEYFKALGLTTTDISYVDFLFEDGVSYFFIKGSANEKIEFCKKGKL